METQGEGTMRDEKEGTVVGGGGGGGAERGEAGRRSSKGKWESRAKEARGLRRRRWKEDERVGRDRGVDLVMKRRKKKRRSTEEKGKEEKQQGEAREGVNA